MYAQVICKARLVYYIRRQKKKASLHGSLQSVTACI